MLKLTEIFSARKSLWRLQGEVEQLRRENIALRAQNDSMRQGMRRCVTCDYRIDFKQRQDRSDNTGPTTTARDS